MNRHALVLLGAASFTLLSISRAVLAAEHPQTAKQIEDGLCRTVSEMPDGKQVVVGNLTEREVYLRLFRLTFFRAMINPFHEAWCRRPHQTRDFLPTDKDAPKKCRVGWKRVSDDKYRWTYGPWIRKKNPEEIIKALKSWVRQEAPTMLEKMEFQTECVPDWNKHPEQREGEMQMGYCHGEEMDRATNAGLGCDGLLERSRYKSLRIGKVYYSYDGGVNQFLHPLFVKRSEIEAACLDPEAIEARWR